MLILVLRHDGNIICCHLHSGIQADEKIKDFLAYFKYMQIKLEGK